MGKFVTPHFRKRTSGGFTGALRRRRAIVSVRIVHLLNDVKFAGAGLGNVAIDLAIEQRMAGHDVAMIALGGGFEPLLARAGVKHYKLPGNDLLRPWRLLSSHSAALRDFRPDVIHAHVRAGLLGILPYAKKTRTPIFAHIHNVYEWQTRLFLLADHIIAVSDVVKEKMRRMGCPERKLHVVLNGPLHSPRLENVDQKSVRLERPAIVTVAGLNWRKGISELIEAFTRLSVRHPTAHLYIVGDGPNRKEFEDLAASSSACRRIVFEGFQGDPRPYMAAADVFVLASRRESFPLVILEARDAGCAIVTTDVDGIPEAVDFGAAARLVPASDAATLATAIAELLEDDAARAQLAAASRMNLAKFTSRKMAESVTLLYTEVLASRS